MRSLLKKKAEAAASQVPAWHPNFRNYQRLPDIKVVRTAFFINGFAALIAIALIAEQPRHGYEIIKVLEEKTEGWYSPSPGIVYPTLTYLEEAGYVTAQAEGAKKLYAITDEGKAHLDANRAFVDAVLERLKAAGERFGHIRFGSRTDLYLPAGARLLVAPGQRMIGGETVMAHVSRTAGALDPTLRTLHAELTPDAQSRALVPGGYVRVAFDVPRDEPVNIGPDQGSTSANSSPDTTAAPETTVVTTSAPTAPVRTST